MNKAVLKEKIVKMLNKPWAIVCESGGREEVASQICDLIEQDEQQVDDVDWEVIEYYHIPTSKIGKPVIANSQSTYWNNAKNNLDDEWGIYAVRIKSTGIVYRIGDTIRQKGANGTRIIKSFKPDMPNGNKHFGGMAVEVEPTGYFAIADIEPVEEKTDMEIDGVKYILPLQIATDINKLLQSAVKKERYVVLITDDGVTMFNENDEVWLINGDGVPDTEPTKIEKCGRHVRERDVLGNGNVWHIFSSKAAMDEFIKMNKPMFSIQELMDLDKADMSVLKGYDRFQLLYKDITKAAEIKLKQ